MRKPLVYGETVEAGAHELTKHSSAGKIGVGETCGIPQSDVDLQPLACTNHEGVD